LKTLGGALTTAQRLSLASAFVLVVVIVGGSAIWLQRPEYTLLFADMDPEAAADVVSRLKTQNVDYQLDAGGRAVRVPASKVDELRLEFSSQGLPSSGRIGFEIFDRTAFGATEFLEQVNYRRALEGEIARTISTLSEVSGARVHIAMSRQSLFASKEQAAKASVVLKLRGSRPPSPSTVQGITNLVASSVEGLKPEAVVVVDTSGRPLSKPAVEGEEPLGGVQIERQQRIERDLTSKVVALLEPVVGNEGVRVNVSVRLDPNSEESTEERWDPTTQAVRSRQVTGDVGSIANAQGIAGSRANLPPPAAPDGAAPTTPTAPVAPVVADASRPVGRGSETTNFEISRTTRHTVRPRGDVARLSVAVILDNEAVFTRADDGTMNRSSKPRSPESIQKIHGLVAAAVGLDTERGDQLTVENVPFGEPLSEEPEPSGLWQRVAPQAYDGVRLLTPLVLGLLAFFFILRPLVRTVMNAPATAARAKTSAPPPSVQELEGSSRRSSMQPSPRNRQAS
jgi:flagellar M-ring protein FliF